MKAPTYIIKRIHLDQEKSKEYQLHLKRLLSISNRQSEPRKKYKATVKLMKNIQMNHILSNKFHEQELQYNRNLQNKNLLQSLLDISFNQSPTFKQAEINLQDKENAVKPVKVQFIKFQKNQQLNQRKWQSNGENDEVKSLAQQSQTQTSMLQKTLKLPIIQEKSQLISDYNKITKWKQMSPTSLKNNQLQRLSPSSPQQQTLLQLQPKRSRKRNYDLPNNSFSVNLSPCSSNCNQHSNQSALRNSNNSRSSLFFCKDNEINGDVQILIEIQSIKLTEEAQSQLIGSQSLFIEFISGKNKVQKFLIENYECCQGRQLNLNIHSDKTLSCYKQFIVQTFLWTLDNQSNQHNLVGNFDIELQHFIGRTELFRVNQQVIYNLNYQKQKDILDNNIRGQIDLKLSVLGSYFECNDQQSEFFVDKVQQKQIKSIDNNLDQIQIQDQNVCNNSKRRNKTEIMLQILDKDISYQ